MMTQTIYYMALIGTLTMVISFILLFFCSKRNDPVQKYYRGFLYLGILMLGFTMFMSFVLR